MDDCATSLASVSTILRIGLLSAAFPPDFDGIGDYTYWLASALAQNGVEASVWTSRGPTRAACEGIEVHPFFEVDKPQSVKALPGLLAGGHSLDWLVVQYNPFAFGRWGYCPWLVSTLRRLKKSGQCRVAVMFHETQVPNRPFKLWVMRQWQNRQLRALARLADVVFVSTTRWESEIKEVEPKAVCHHLPVGSNLPCSKLSREIARQNLGISSETLVLGMFGSSHPSRMTDWMSAAVGGAASVQDKLVVLYVGKDGKIFREVCAGFAFMDEGPLPAEAAADRMRAMDLLISPFIDGISTRRGSAIAGFQHGVAVASTWAPHTDAVLRDGAPASLILAPRDDRNAFVEKINQWIVAKWKKGEQGHEEMEAFYERHFAWPVIARKTVECLR
ncbi:MAG TPA: glycosyltransferase family 4 protein [Terrimicrobiaceae bacterium]